MFSDITVWSMEIFWFSPYIVYIAHFFISGERFLRDPVPVYHVRVPVLKGLLMRPAVKKKEFGDLYASATDG